MGRYGWRRAEPLTGDTSAGSARMRSLRAHTMCDGNAGEHRLELRQLRYFVRVVELGSMGRAALDPNLVQSALSQQISRLEGELSTRLLQRTPRGVVPTEAGAAFFREAQLTLRHAAQAVRAAQQVRLQGTVSVGPPTTAGMPPLDAGNADPLPRCAAAHGREHVWPPRFPAQRTRTRPGRVVSSACNPIPMRPAAVSGKSNLCCRKTCS